MIGEIEMKKFISGVHSVSQIIRYRQSLIRKYKLSSNALQQADLVVLDGFVCKDRYNDINSGKQSVSQIQNIVVGGATSYGVSRLYMNFEVL